MRIRILAPPMAPQPFDVASTKFAAPERIALQI
jgi:hypothetical protein